jgi:hypothetical protein
VGANAGWRGPCRNGSAVAGYWRLQAVVVRCYMVRFTHVETTVLMPTTGICCHRSCPRCHRELIPNLPHLGELCLWIDRVTAAAHAFAPHACSVSQPLGCPCSLKTRYSCARCILSPAGTWHGFLLTTCDGRPRRGLACRLPGGPGSSAAGAEAAACQGKAGETWPSNS